MSKEEHAAILEVYLNRVSIEALNRVLIAKKGCLYQSMHGSAAGQTNARLVLSKMIDEAIDSINAFNLDLCATTIENAQLRGKA